MLDELIPEARDHPLEQHNGPIAFEDFYVLAYMMCGNTIVRTKLFRRFGGFYDRTRALYAEDSWFWTQVLLNAPVLIRFEPMTFLHREASELSANLTAGRPIEPFLVDASPSGRRARPTSKICFAGSRRFGR